MSQKSSYPLCKRLLLHSPCYCADGQRRFRVHMFQGVFQFWLLLPGVSFDCLGLLSCSEAGFSSPALKPLEKFDMLPFYRLQSYIYSSGLLSKERSCSPCSSLCKTLCSRLLQWGISGFLLCSAQQVLCLLGLLQSASQEIASLFCAI